ncbi:MAG: serpin family protein [Armatimonadota bacterium]
MARRLVLVGVPVVLCAGAALMLLARAEEPKESDVSVDKRLISANTRFAFALFRELVTEHKDKNVFISPASVALALSMTYNGASGSTKQAMAKVLSLNGINLEELNKASAAFLANLKGPGPGVRLEVANSLWARKDIRFKPDFIERNRRYYQAEVTSLDFASPNAVPTINSWVSDHTGGKIKEIVKQIGPRSILFLINSVYFKGTWSERFDPSDTHMADFRLLDGFTKRVPMMFRSGRMRYLPGDGFRAVSLPYGKGRLSMYIFLPDEDSSLAAFIKKLNVANWEKWMQNFSSVEVDLSLPRFRIEFESELQKALTALGMGVAFDPDRADFRAMCPIPPLPNVFIASVTHKTFVEVNEEGTEATAATKVEMALKAMPPSAIQFVVDQPFFCAIRDNKTGSVLFAGAIVEPM